MTELATALHALAAVVWVGGMAFAYCCLRPAMAELEGPVRQALWVRVFSRFFPLVVASIAVLLVTGYWIIFGAMGGFAGAGLHVHLMQATGLLMMALFEHLFFAPWKRLKAAVAAKDWAAGATQIGQIRTFVAINLGLGVLTVLIGASGHYWG